MKKYLLLVIFSILFILSSCEKYDEYVLPVVGNYEASIVGVAGPFNMVVSVDYGTHILIDAPFDGYEWYVAEIRVKDKEDYRKRLVIDEQQIDQGIYLFGEGIYYDKSIQLDYTISFEGIEYDYTLVGSKY